MQSSLTRTRYQASLPLKCFYTSVFFCDVFLFEVAMSFNNEMKTLQVVAFLRLVPAMSMDRFEHKITERMIIWY